MIWHVVWGASVVAAGWVAAGLGAVYLGWFGWRCVALRRRERAEVGR